MAVAFPADSVQHAEVFAVVPRRGREGNHSTVYGQSCEGGHPDEFGGTRGQGEQPILSPAKLDLEIPLVGSYSV